MKNANKLIGVALVLVILPTLAKCATFYRGSYDPGELPVVDDSRIIDSLPVYYPYDDQPAEGAGAVIFDLSHRNNTSINDLTPLRERVVKRGVELIDFDASTGFDESALRRATALVIVSPTEEYSESEREAIRDFADDGGRVLLAADPTRTAELVIDDLYEAFFPESAIPAINSVANDFGIVYVDDYIYNIKNNEGNYRNVIFRDFAEENSLTDGLLRMIVFAAHSLLGDGTPMAIGDKNTFSPVRTGETNLSPIMLSEDGQLLALGDVTFLTPPFHTMADNDRFLSNIADWLGTAQRERDINDFPYLFTQPVDLISISEGPIDPQLILQVNRISDALAETGLSASLSATGRNGRDKIRVGTFEDAEAVDSYLSLAHVDIVEEDGDNLIESSTLGTFNSGGVTLYITYKSELAINVIILAEDDDAVVGGIARLIRVDFSDCVQSGMVTLCTNGERGADSSDDEEEEVDSFVADFCGDIPISEAIDDDLPRIGTPEESQCYFEQGLAFMLEFFSGDLGQETPYEPGDVYLYAITMSDSLDGLWLWGWCTSPDQFEDNWENITITFTLNGVEIPLSDFYVFDDGDENISCRRYIALVTDWPDGYHELVTYIIFETDLDDGLSDDVYEAGSRTIVYEVSVGE